MVSLTQKVEPPKVRLLILVHSVTHYKKNGLILRLWRLHLVNSLSFRKPHINLLMRVNLRQPLKQWHLWQDSIPILQRKPLNQLNKRNHLRKLLTLHWMQPRLVGCVPMKLYLGNSTKLPGILHNYLKSYGRFLPLVLRVEIKCLNHLKTLVELRVFFKF